MSGPVPVDVLAALGRLNRHARASYSAKAAIYAYKTAVAVLLAETRGLALCRGIEWFGPCLTCGGTGTWKSWEGEYSAPCRSCGAKRMRRLRFIETTLPDGQVWHHPWDHGSDRPGHTIAAAFFGSFSYPDKGGMFYRCHDGRELQFIWWPTVEDWKPRTKGEAVAPEDLARHLNLVEDWLIGYRGPAGWSFERALRERGDYLLDLGRTTGCFLCGGVAYSALSCGNDLFRFTVEVCREHCRLPVAEWPKAPPAAMITPTIAAWAEQRRAAGPLPAFVSGRAA